MMENIEISNLKLNEYCEFFVSTKDNIYSYYNHLNNQYLILTKKEYESLLEKDFKRLDADFINKLIRNKYLVSVQEKLDNILIFKRIKHNLLKERRLYIDIIPTYDCNLKCNYCYSSPSRKDIKMDHYTARYLCQFIKRLAQKLNLHKLYIGFLGGGEPLLCTEVIDKILAFFYNKEGYNIPSIITTNATLLDESIISLLAKYNITYQIVIDGLETCKTKKFLNSNRSCSRLQLRNLEKLIKIIKNKNKIHFGINIDKSNMLDIDKYLHFLQERNILQKTLFGYQYITYFEKSVYCEHFAFKIISGSNYFSQADLEDAMKVSKIIEVKHNLFPPKNFIPLNYTCTKLINPYYFCIDPQGDIYKCQVFCNDSRHKIGNIFQGIDEIIDRKWESIQEIKIPDSCMECKIFPYCLGGCRGFSYRLFGDLNKEYCVKDLIKSLIIQRIKKYKILEGDKSDYI